MSLIENDSECGIRGRKLLTEISSRIVSDDNSDYNQLELYIYINVYAKIVNNIQNTYTQEISQVSSY